MTDKEASGLSIRPSRAEDVEAVLELWRQAEATPSVTDTAADLRRLVAAGAASVLVAEAEGRLVGSIIGTFDGWRSIPTAGGGESPVPVPWWPRLTYSFTVVYYE